MLLQHEDRQLTPQLFIAFRVGVLVLLTSTVRANRPSGLEEEYLQVHHEGNDQYSILAGGHFARGHNQRQHSRGVAPKLAPKLAEKVEGSVPDAAGAAESVAKKIKAPDVKNAEDFPVLPVAQCGKDFKADEKGACSSQPDCPFTAESENECHFKCVKPTACGTDGTNVNNTIPDKEAKICRHCAVEGCLTCQPGKPGEGTEMCTQCMPGYYLTGIDGKGFGKKCVCWTIWIFLALAGFAVCCFIAFAVWFMELLGRPTVNEPGLQYGLECRARSKVLQPTSTQPSENPDDGIGPKKLYPFNTNLCTKNIGGPGNILFFRYQAAIWVWAVVLITAWVIAVQVTDPNLFSLGLKSAPTPQTMCYIVMEGRKIQLKYVWLKVYWLIFAYFFSFLGAIIYAVSCRRLFQALDNEHTTMADFVALCRSLPVRKGDQPLEQAIKDAVEKETGQKVIGVSVCWDFHEKVREIKEALEEDIGSIEHAGAVHGSTTRWGPKGEGAERTAGGEHEPGIEDENAGCLKGIMDKINNTTLAKWHCHFHDEYAKPETEEQKATKITEVLHSLENTEMAFVVFETENGRDQALEQTKGNAIPLGEDGFFLAYEDHEPESCCWEDFYVDEVQISARLFKGVILMTISLCCWTFLLYMPYAHYMGSFSYANGDVPGEMSEGLFVGLVVASQLGLFVVASVASHHAGFCFEDDKQKTYIVLYNAALIVNLILDMSLTAFLAFHQMCGRGVRTADGRLLADLPNLQEIFESYPMQKAMGNNLFKYCWPATFFIPFFAEPFACQIGPYIVGSFLVRSNKKMQGENAEKALELSEAEQGRYADCIFNAILVAAMPFLAPGYMLKGFAAMIFSHTYIYCYDHWRVLRCCAKFWMASDVVSTFSQKLFCIPVGILAAALVFKGNQYQGALVGAARCPGKVWEGLCTSLGAGPLQGTALFVAMGAALFGHMILHVLVLNYVVPVLGRSDSVNASEKYEECAKHTPCTWFSSNPVHCLRSKYIFKDDPPQVLCITGKEHLQKKNPKIGAYYEEEELKVDLALGL